MGNPDKIDARRSRMLIAARKAFMKNGFQRTSLDQIIAESGGSRRNIYDLFGDKEGLFEAVLRGLMEDVLDRADVLPKPGASPRDGLITFGTNFLTGMLNPDVLAAFRQFITISADRPDLGRQAYESGPAVLHGKLGHYLDTLVERGVLRPIDTRVAARTLIEMLKGDFQLRALVTGDNAASPDDIRNQVTVAVDLFLSGAARAETTA